MNWIKVGGYILIIVPALFTGIVLTMYLLQDYMIFLSESLPKNYQYKFNKPFEEYTFQHKEGHEINALFFQSDAKKGLVYYQHGNAGNLQGWGTLAENFLNNGFDVLFYDYRGYGKSTGRIRHEHQLHNDAEFVLSEFLRDKQFEKLVIYGNSLGTGIAAKLAVKIQPNALILETPYYSFSDLIKHHYPFLPARILSKYKLRTHKFVKELQIPILILHGTADDVVPYNCSEKLKALSDNIELITIRGGVHNNLPNFKLFQQSLKSFLDKQ
ncbi:MAG: alpha/beta fold hydrolase [Vicingaceae bacterium]